MKVRNERLSLDILPKRIKNDERLSLDNVKKTNNQSPPLSNISSVGNISGNLSVIHITRSIRGNECI